MKTKLFFLFAAFALLLSVNAVAQSNGDVNAPVYYYYIGQDPITADNYTTLAETSDTLLKEKEYTIERYGYMYVLCPNSVTSIKVQQPGLGFWSDDSVIIDTSVSIPGHTVFKTTGRCGAHASILIEFDYTPVATSIDPVTNTNAERVIYDMRGRKLTDVEKLRSGIYIVNGRKLIVK